MNEQKELPNSEEAERAVLGSVLIDSERCYELCSDSGVSGEWFLNHSNRITWNILSSMLSDGLKTDLMTVGARFKDEGRLGSVGGYAYLEGLIDGTPTSAHCQHYLEIVEKDFHRREIIRSAQEAVRLCYSDNPPDEITASLTKSVESIGQTEPEQSDEEIIKAHRNAQRGNPNCIPTPFESLTRRTGGVRKKMVTVLTGRSKAGKSMLKSFWIHELAKQGFKGVDFCFEDKWEISKKRIASIGKYKISDLDAGGRYHIVGDKFHWECISDQEIERERESLEELAKLPIWFYDKKIDIKKLRSVVSKYKRKHKIDYIFIDGAKDMKRPSGKYNDCGFEEEVSQALTEIASEFDIAVIAIHHLTKIPDNELITPNSIRGSGNIVSDSRSVYALQGDRNGAGLDKYFDSHGQEKDEEGYVTTRVLECIVNNHGQSGKVWMGTDLAKCDFWKV